MARTFTETVQATTGGVIAVGALAAAIPDLTGKIKALLNNLGLPVPNDWIIWAILALLLLVALSLLRRGLSRKSRLLRPESLLIDPGNPEHLRGRDDDIRRLSDAVAHRPLIFLEGESGSGKSALVRSGLIPALRAQPPAAGVLPVYLNAYSGDWEQGLAAQLASAAWRALGESVREHLGIGTQQDLRQRLLTPNADDDASKEPREESLLYRIRNELGLTPLLIFDQFDDYQLAHRDHFLRDGRWITPDLLTAENALWQSLRAELDRQAIHCLFVTRRELFGSLEAVRFQQPETFFLDRVEPVYITSLLERLVAPDSDRGLVISSPDAGWEALKERLIGDLASQGRILPIQARVALKGLIELPYLSVSTYERKGGLQGLEAGTVEDATSTAARAGDVPPHRVLDSLLLLVDETDPELPKARTAPTAVLGNAIQAEPARVERVLETLLQHGVVRPQIGDQSQVGTNRGLKSDASREKSDEAEVAWSLYHDYLARPVLTAHRRANRWQRLLKDRLRAFHSAANWRERWRAMLSPWEQIKLIWPTLTRRVKWAGYRRLALVSGTRMLPLLGALVISGFAGDWYLDERAIAQADRILSAIRGGLYDEDPEREEYRQLWSLATGSSRLKRAFLDRAIEDRRSARALAAHAQRVNAALFGVDPQGVQRSWALAQLLSQDLTVTPTDLLLFKAKSCVLLFASAPKRFAGHASEVGNLVFRAVAVTTDWNQLSQLGKALGSLGERLPPAQAEAGAQKLVAAMAKTTDRRALRRLGDALGSLGERLPPAQAEAGAQKLVAAMAKTTDEERLSQLGNTLGSLGERLPPAQAEAGAQKLLAAMTETTDSWLSELGAALGGLGERLPPAQTEVIAQKLVAAMTETTDSYRLSELGAALGGLGERLPPAQAEAGAQKLVAAMAKTTDRRALRRLGDALGSLGERLLPTQADAISLRVAELMASSGEAHQFVNLAAILRDLGVSARHAGVDTAPDLLQNPMAYSQTLSQLLNYYSRLAGTPDDSRFKTIEELVTWAQEHRPELDLTRRPHMPKVLVQ